MPTDAQLRVIRFIESNLGIEFVGFTKDEARKFISDNIDRSKNAKKLKGQSFINDLVLVNMMQDNDNSYTKHEVMKKDMFGSYLIDRNGDIFEDENYDYHSYADIGFSTM